MLLTVRDRIRVTLLLSALARCKSCGDSFQLGAEISRRYGLLVDPDLIRGLAVHIPLVGSYGGNSVGQGSGDGAEQQGSAMRVPTEGAGDDSDEWPEWED